MEVRAAIWSVAQSTTARSERSGSGLQQFGASSRLTHFVCAGPRGTDRVQPYWTHQQVDYQNEIVKLIEEPKKRAVPAWRGVLGRALLAPASRRATPYLTPTAQSGVAKPVRLSIPCCL